MSVESPHYGMVVTDGVAGRVWMLTARTRVPRTLVPHADDALLWEAVRINTPDGMSTVAAEPGRVFLAPGEWAEVVAADHEYPFLGGPAHGRTFPTGGSPVWRWPVPPTYRSVFEEADGPIAAVDYALHPDGCYRPVPR